MPPHDAPRQGPFFQTKTQRCLRPILDRTRQIHGRRSAGGKPVSKHWRLKYRLHGKENRFSIGAYPEIGLKDARESALAARHDIADMIAPLKAKTDKIEAQLLNEVRTFEYVAEQWLNFKSAELVSKSPAGFRGALTNHVFPLIGRKPVTEIKLEHISAILTTLRSQGTMAMAKRGNRWSSQQRRGF